MGKLVRVLKPETIKSLIGVIRNYPEIYANGHTDYKNAYKKAMAWKKVKEKMGMDVRTLKIKWKNLRGTFRKHKICLLMGNKATTNLSNWVWAKEMSFMEPHVKIRPIDIASKISGDSSDSEENDNTEEENEQNHNETVPSPEPEIAINRCPERKQHEHGDAVEKLVSNINTELKSERNPLENLVDVPCDRIDMEFLGYANIVKSLSIRSQALIRLQITKILTRFQLEELSNNSNNDSSYMTATQLTDLQPYFIDVEQKYTPEIQNSTTK